MQRVIMRGSAIQVLAQESYERTLSLVWYLARGPLWGIRQQIEPDASQPPKLAAGILLAGVLASVALTSGALQLGLVWILLSPVLLYSFSRVPEVIYDHRAYLTLPGAALLASWAADQQPALMFVLALLYAFRTIGRTTRMRTALGYWKLAVEESPNHWRPRWNYADQLLKAGRQLEAIPWLRRLLDAPRPCGETAAAQLAGVYIACNQLDAAEQLVGARGQAILTWPNHPGIRRLRARLLEAQGRPDQAQLVYQIAERLPQ